MASGEKAQTGAANPVSVDDSTPLYRELGVSASKNGVRRALQGLGNGLYPQAFCKIVPDIAGDPDFCTVMHSDGTGTKALLAFDHWTGFADRDALAWLAQDAMAMNLNDLACVGAVDNIIYNSTVNRNSHVMSDYAVGCLVEGMEAVAARLHKAGISITGCGGETADVRDIVSTFSLDVAMVSRLPRAGVVDNGRIADGDVIVGLSSRGADGGSGIGSNGFTLVRHRLQLPLSREVERELLSPTPVYTPVIRDILRQTGARVHGMTHCTGGGQTKDLHCVSNKDIVKDNLFDPPSVFNMIARAIGDDWRQMYAVFNMGHLIEVFTTAADAQRVIDIAASHGIEARVVGHVSDTPAGRAPQLVIDSAKGLFKYTL